MSVDSRIRELLGSHDVVLFMKGSRRAPSCGFSATVVEVLDDYLDDYTTVDVLADTAVREGVKAFTDWPTIPQLFVRAQFVGGADIVKELAESGELEGLLGRPRKVAELPDVRLTESAVRALQGYAGEGAPVSLRIKVSGDFDYALDLDAARPGDLVVRGEGYQVVLDRPSARRIDGTVVDFLERPDGGGFKLDNPNEPPRVRSMSVVELRDRLAAHAPVSLFDVRTDAERAVAALPQAMPLDEAGKRVLEDLDRDATVVLMCHHGVRSRAAADHVLRMGFRNVFNLEGGIDAWSVEVDPSVPRY